MGGINTRLAGKKPAMAFNIQVVSRIKVEDYIESLHNTRTRDGKLCRPVITNTNVLCRPGSLDTK